MSNTGLNTAKRIPLWLLAELTYACPLQCPYCSNPVNYSESRKHELSTGQWVRVMREARQLGAVQLGFSGGEPLIRRDLEELISEGRQLGFYTNLITSSVGMDAQRIRAMKQAGLDHIQVSFQGSDAQSSLQMAGTDVFEHKLAMAREIKNQGYPMVLNFVLHRQNIDRIEEFLQLAEELEADFVELANTQYYGWALENRAQLLPTREQLRKAEAITNEFRAKQCRAMEIFFVVPDYYEDRPKACSGGWASTFMTVTPDGTVLPCQSAQVIPGLEFPNVTDKSLAWIWHESPLFNAFRGTDWMREPCSSCPEQSKDFGGCRCQAYMLTGDARNADPVCSLSPHHERVSEAVRAANAQDLIVSDASPLLWRNPRNAKIKNEERAQQNKVTIK